MVQLVEEDLADPREHKVRDSSVTHDFYIEYAAKTYKIGNISPVTTFIRNHSAYAPNLLYNLIFRQKEQELHLMRSCPYMI